MIPAPKPDPPKIPMDFTWAKRLGFAHKLYNFMLFAISEDHCEDLKYGGTPISEVFANDVGVGRVLALPAKLVSNTD